MTPIGTGPWLDDGRDTRACQWITGGGLVLFLATAGLLHGLVSWHKPWYYQPPSVLVFFFVVSCLMMGFGAAWFVVLWLLRRRVQTCPACLGSMTRGATTCPHCHFHERTESV